MTEKWIHRFVAAFAVIGAVYTLYYLRTVTIPILIAAFLAYLLDPVIDRLEGFKISRRRSILLLTILSISLILLALLTVIPAVERELSAAAKSLPKYLNKIKQNVVPHLEGLARQYFPAYSIQELLQKGESFITNVPPDIWKRFLSALLLTFKGTLGFVVSVIGTLIIPLYLYYILKDFDVFKEQLISLIPVSSRDFVVEKLREVDSALSAFIRGQLLICLILAAIYSAGLSIIGIDLPIAIGTLSGAAFIIPYVGTLLGGSAAVFVAFLKFQDFLHPLYVVLLYGGAQLLEGTFITPKIIGDKMGLHPLVIIVSIITGGELFGFVGILIAVPAVAAIKIFAAAALESYRKSAFYNA